jgi:hypothetical protein
MLLYALNSISSLICIIQILHAHSYFVHSKYYILHLFYIYSKSQTPTFMLILSNLRFANVMPYDQLQVDAYLLDLASHVFLVFVFSLGNKLASPVLYDTIYN